MLARSSMWPYRAIALHTYTRCDRNLTMGSWVEATYLTVSTLGQRASRRWNAVRKAVHAKIINIKWCCSNKTNLRWVTTYLRSSSLTLLTSILMLPQEQANYWRVKADLGRIFKFKMNRLIKAITRWCRRRMGRCRTRVRHWGINRMFQASQEAVSTSTRRKALSMRKGWSGVLLETPAS